MTDLAARPLRRARANAHTLAVTAAPSAIVEQLQDVLGQALVAVLVHKDVRTVSRWTSPTSATSPTRHDDRLLRDALQVQALLLAVEKPDVVRAWFTGMNPQLDDVSPIEALSDGRARDVMAAARAFVNAG